MPGAPDPNPSTAANVVFIPHLADLIMPDEYADHPDGRLVRVQIRVTDDGIQILADGFRPAVVEDLLATLGAGTVEQMLCG
jgi:FtsH ternary system-associated peptide